MWVDEPLIELRVARIVIGIETEAPPIAPIIAAQISLACALKKFAIGAPLSPLYVAADKVQQAIRSNPAMSRGHLTVSVDHFLYRGGQVPIRNSNRYPQITDRYFGPSTDTTARLALFRL